MGATLMETIGKRNGRPAPVRTDGGGKRMAAIKLSYWVGIGVDALWAVGFLIPQVYALLVGYPDFTPDFQTRQLMLAAGSLMTGWTFLLVWALQKPVARRGVLLLTAFPVIFGLSITTVNGISNGNPVLYWVLVKLAVLMIAMVGSHFLASKLANLDNHLSPTE